MRLLSSSARDVNRPGRDAATGPGELDVASAVARVAGGDGAGLRRARAQRRRRRPGQRAAARPARGARHRRPLRGQPRRLPRRRCGAGERLDARLRGPEGAEFDLLVFTPGGGSIAGLGHAATRRLVAGSLGARSNERVRYRAPRTGVYNVVVWAARGTGAYELVVRRG